MTRESEAEEPSTTKDEKKRRFGWAIALSLLILGVLLGVGIRWYNQSQNEQLAQNKKSLGEERVRLEKELHKTRGALKDCEAKAKCTPAKKNARKKPCCAIPKPPVVRQTQVKEKKFDPWDCGEGTEAVFNKAAGKPECRMIAVEAPLPARVARVAEAPKQKPEMVCEKPNIRELRDDDSIACIAPPSTQPAQQATSDGCLPPDQHGRIFCRRTEVKSGSSWVPWALGGAAVVAIIANNRHKGGGGSSSPTVVTNPPSPGPSVTTLPVGPGVTTLQPGPGIITH